MQHPTRRPPHFIPLPHLTVLLTAPGRWASGRASRKLAAGRWLSGAARFALPRIFGSVIVAESVQRTDERLGIRVHAGTCASLDDCASLRPHTYPEWLHVAWQRIRCQRRSLALPPAAPAAPACGRSSPPHPLV